VTEIHETAIDARKKREELNAQRNRLFEQYLRNPSSTLLALKIRTVDDQVAESMERSTAKRTVRR
jgi:hypothetical protein